jgi:hypothetical protein
MFDALMENCFFYISRMYEFLHRLGQILTPRSAPTCLLPNADIAMLAGRAAQEAKKSMVMR